VVQSTRLAFSRDAEIDTAEDRRLIKIMENPSNEIYSFEDLASINLIQSSADIAMPNLKSIESLGQHVEMKVAVVEGEKDNTGFGEVIVDASVEECAVLEFINFSRRNLNDFYGKDGGILKDIFKNNNHCFVNRSIYTLIPGFYSREFIWKVIWKRLSADEFIVVYEPVELNSVWNFPIAEDKVVRASSWTLVKYRRLPAFAGIPQTKI